MMVKSGVIIGAVGFFLVLGTTLIFVFCAPCWGLLMGLAAGYLAGVFDKPIDNNDTIKKGAIAGAIAAAICLLGGVIGGLINAVAFDPVQMQEFYDMFDMETPTQSMVWMVQLGGSICIGVLDIALMAGLGAAGGALWWQTTGKNHPMQVIPPVFD